jgi:hypothetical protein
VNGLAVCRLRLAVPVGFAQRLPIDPISLIGPIYVESRFFFRLLRPERSTANRKPLTANRKLSTANPSSPGSSQSIPKPTNGFDVSSAIAEFISEPAHMRVYGPGIDHRVVTPDIAK